MSERDRGLAIAMLVEAFGTKDFTPVRVRVYDKALESVPVAILQPMVQRAITTRTWFPKPAELLEDAEACRRELRASLKFEPCENCSQDGWTSRLMDGVLRMVRCDCWQAHQQKVLALGVGEKPLALTAGREADLTQVSE
jgi:hypothetical protein